MTEALGGEVTHVDLTDSKLAFHTIQLTQDDVAVISVPSYGGRVPATAVERLATLNGQGARAVLVCVYGNRAYEDTLVELEDAANQAGFQVIAAVATIAEHSIVRQFAAGRPDAQDAQQLANFAKQIQSKLSAGFTSKPAIPGNRPYKRPEALVWYLSPPKSASTAVSVHQSVLYRPLIKKTLKSGRKSMYLLHALYLCLPPTPHAS